MLRKVVRHAISSGFWNTIPIEAVGPRTGSLFTRMTPPEGGISPDTSFSSVLFPQPLGPTRATNSPSSAAIDTRSSACTAEFFAR